MYLFKKFKNRKTLQNYDPFKQLKNKAFNESEVTMIAIAKFLILQFSKKEEDDTKLKILFVQMLKVCVILMFFLKIINKKFIF